jgi:hypothetical protein
MMSGPIAANVRFGQANQLDWMRRFPRCDKIGMQDTLTDARDS